MVFVNFRRQNPFLPTRFYWSWKSGLFLWRSKTLYSCILQQNQNSVSPNGTKPVKKFTSKNEKTDGHKCQTLRTEKNSVNPKKSVICYLHHCLMAPNMALVWQWSTVFFLLKYCFALMNSYLEIKPHGGDKIT